MKPIVDEGTTAYLSCGFRDKKGGPDAPVSVTYRIDCVSSGTVVRPDTGVPAGASVEIVLSSLDNAIVNPASTLETKRVTVRASYGAGDDVNGQYEYRVRRLQVP